MAALVFDLETIGLDFDQFDDITKHILVEAVADKEDLEAKTVAAREKLGLSPLTGQICAVCALDSDSGKGAVYFQAPGQQIDEQIDGVRYCSMSEKEILEQFWKLAARFDEFVTFNGRCFDIPFLLLRSAVYRMRPNKHLMKGRYLYQQERNAQNIDLMDQLSFYGATRNMKLHLCCQALGIPSPKGEGTDGGHVQVMFNEGRFMDIARYNVADVKATTELYKLWCEYLRF